jgi:hypothetical protein
MNAVIFGIVESELTSIEGYYRVNPSVGTGFVVGVSIRGNTLTVGSLVGIVQCGWRGQNAEWGFFNVDQDMVSVLEPDPAVRNSMIETCPAGATLNYLAQKSGVVGTRYRPAVVIVVSAATLTVVERWTQKTLDLPVTTELSASDFVVGDIVLIGAHPDRRVQIEGWWQPTAADWVEASDNTFDTTLPHWFGLYLPTGTTEYQFWLRAVDFVFDFAGAPPTTPASITIAIGTSTFAATKTGEDGTLVTYQAAQAGVKPLGLKWTVTESSPFVIYSGVKYYKVDFTTSLSGYGYSMLNTHPFLLRRTVAP